MASEQVVEYAGNRSDNAAMAGFRERWAGRLRRPGRWRLWLSWSVLAGLVAAVAVSAFVVQRELRTGWAAVVVAAAAAAGLFVQPLREAVGRRGGGQRSLLRAQCWVDEVSGWLPRVKDLSDPVALGVHPAAPLGEAEGGGWGVDLPATAPGVRAAGCRRPVGPGAVAWGVGAAAGGLHGEEVPGRF